MAYYYDNLKLDKGMYREAGRSFSQVLESQDGHQHAAPLFQLDQVGLDLDGGGGDGRPLVHRLQLFLLAPLDKGMYREAGRSFSQVLESQDPSERYKGTSLEGLDAFQRQLKRLKRSSFWKRTAS